jgi:hypothetical protein
MGSGVGGVRQQTQRGFPEMLDAINDLNAAGFT